MSQRRWRSQDLEGWFILSRMPNSSHMSIKPFDGWSADWLIYGALKSDTRSMGCSCGKSSLSQGALNQRARVDQLHEGILRYSRLFSSARVHKEEVIGCRYSTQECWSYLEIPSNTELALILCFQAAATTCWYSGCQSVGHQGALGRAQKIGFYCDDQI